MNTAQSSSPESDHYYVEDNNAEILFDDGTSNDDQYETAEVSISCKWKRIRCEIP